MGAADKSAEHGGCGCMDLGIDLLGGGIVGHVVLVDDSLHWEGVG